MLEIIIIENRPSNPVEFVAQYLLQNNPENEQTQE